VAVGVAVAGAAADKGGLPAAAGLPAGPGQVAQPASSRASNAAVPAASDLAGLEDGSVS